MIRGWAIHLYIAVHFHTGHRISRYPVSTVSSSPPRVRSNIHARAGQQFTLILCLSSRPCPFLPPQLHPPTLAEMSDTSLLKGLMSNIGVYTDPKHNLYVGSVGPSVEELQSGASLKPGEVAIKICSTGICG